MSKPASLLLICGLVLAGCAAAGDEPDEDPASAAASSEDALQSSPLADGEMKPVKTPAGMPRPWDQPDSTGTFEEKGMCGPTAVANALRLYGIEASPQSLYNTGVHWFIGTRGIQIRSYFNRYHPELGCTLEHPEDGPAFLRAELHQGHPVLVWFNTQGGLSSHWVTAVGITGSGPSEAVIVMSWGRYYTIDMKKLDAAWRNVYGIRRPAIACGVPARTMVR